MQDMMHVCRGDVRKELAVILQVYLQMIYITASAW